MKQSIRQDKNLTNSEKFNYVEHSLSFKDLSLVETLIDSLERNTLTPNEEIRLNQFKIRTLQEYAVKHADSEEYIKSSKYLLEALKIDPKNSSTLRKLGEMSQKQGKNSESIVYYKEAIKINPRDLWAIKGAVGSALEDDDIKASKELLENALNYMPSEPAVYELLAQVAQKAGDARTALDAIKYSEKLKSKQ